MNPIARFWNFFSTNGRVSRRYYIYCVLTYILLVVIAALSLAAAILYMGAPEETMHNTDNVIGFFLQLGMIAVSVRRLHDIGRSGWWALLMLIPYYVSLVIMLVLACIPGQKGENRFGPDPKPAA